MFIKYKQQILNKTLNYFVSRKTYDSPSIILTNSQYLIIQTYKDAINIYLLKCFR